MNEEQLQRSERIASQLMRVLAIIGLVAVLALIAWLAVWGVRTMRGSGITAAVSSVTSLWKSGPVESLAFDMNTRTLTSNESVTVSWTYAGESAEPYRFSYACVQGVTLAVMRSGAWDTIPCGTAYDTDVASLVILPTSTSTRFADVSLEVARGATKEATTVTIVNTSISVSEGSVAPAGAATSTSATTPAPTPVKTAAPAPTPATVKPSTVPARPAVTTPVQSTVTSVTSPSVPSDLAVDIVETGILMKTSGKNIFFPVSPIPTDKTAAVRFTVTNRGGQSSGSWAFIARLPIEGDSDYRYTSPAQAALAPGMQVEFTLGFDELLVAKTGTITIQIVPGKDTDALSNNTDSTKISIRER